MKNIIEILRWIAVPIAAIAGMFILYWIGRFVVGRLIDPTVINISYYISRFFVELFPGAGFVLCGSFMAPKHQGIVSIVLAVVFCCFSLLSSLFAYNSDSFSYVEIVYILIGCVGAIYSTRLIYNIEKEQK